MEETNNTTVLHTELLELLKDAVEFLETNSKNRSKGFFNSCLSEIVREANNALFNASKDNIVQVHKDMLFFIYNHYMHAVGRPSLWLSEQQETLSFVNNALNLWGKLEGFITLMAEDEKDRNYP